MASHLNPSSATPPSASWAELFQLAPNKHSTVRIHLVGIAGTGLSAIARILLGRGYTVSGSDARAGRTLAELKELGAQTFVGHHPDHVSGAHLVLISSAVPPDNVEVVAANAAGIPVVKRDHFLPALMTGYQNICVAGTHGKTTTTAMIASGLDSVGAEPSFIVGSEILSLGTSARAGCPGGPFVLEADEYDRMFLGLQPHIAVITNVEWDHVDCYPTIDSYREAFAEFARRLPADQGTVVYCGDDPGACWVRAQAEADGRRWVSYGLAPGNQWRAVDLQLNNDGGTDFLVEHHGLPWHPISLTVPGRHNVLNALGTLAALHAAGHDFTEADKNLKFLRDFAGTSRRLEHKGTACGIIVLDDYAHHPTEVRATLSAARQRFPRRAIWVLFQPHTYSRTHALLNEFCDALKNAEHVLITDIYAAREHDTMGVSAHDLIAKLNTHPDARYVGNHAAAASLLLAELQPGDVLLTLGAGDGYQVGDRVLAELRSREQKTNKLSASRVDDLAQEIRDLVGLTPMREEPLAPHTTMRVGGPAELFVTVNTPAQLVAVVNLAHRAGVPTWVLGGGSNVIVSDAGVRGLVIVNNCRAMRRHSCDVVWAESGANLARLARQTIHWQLSGLEWGVSVPGTVGGAVVGNAGAHGGCVADNLLRATLLLPDGRIAEWPAQRFHYGYRHSRLKELIRAGQPTPVVLAAAFQLVPDDATAIEERAARFLAQRRASQPVEPSAGSIFQNPPGDYAGRILEALGFKGRVQGDAMFSTVHANFIVNRGRATAADVVTLINQARQAVWTERGIELVPEVLFVGDWAQMPPLQPLAATPPANEERRP